MIDISDDVVAHTARGTAAPGAQGEATRERMLRLADELFAKHGFARVSMRTVATAAGVTKPALYYHFRDKVALYEECIVANRARVEGMLREALERPGDLRTRVEAMTRALITGITHHPVRVQNDIVEHLTPEVRQRVADGFYRSVMGPVTSLFVDASARGELRGGVNPPLAAFALVGMCTPFLPPLHGLGPEDGVVVARPHFGPSGPPDPDEAIRVVTDLTMSGIAG